MTPLAPSPLVVGVHEGGGVIHVFTHILIGLMAFVALFLVERNGNALVGQ